MRNFVQRLQEISRIRADRWHGGDFRQWSGLEWAGAMCGEAGETANAAKKLRRIELGIDGNAYSERRLQHAELVEQLRKEMADTFIYMTNLASYYEIDLAQAIVDAFNMKSEAMKFPERIEL